MPESIASMTAFPLCFRSTITSIAPGDELVAKWLVIRKFDPSTTIARELCQRESCMWIVTPCNLDRLIVFLLQVNTPRFNIVYLVFDYPHNFNVQCFGKVSPTTHYIIS